MKEDEVYFQPSGIGKDIFEARYARADETFEGACKRVAEHVAEAEVNGNFNKYAERFFEQLATNRFNPGGRIWYGAGRPKAQLLNCLAGETLIHTDEGLRTAKELTGKTVNVLSQDGVYRPATWHHYGLQRLYQVVLKNGDEVFATAQHEWVVTKPKGGTERVTTEELVGRNIPMQHKLSFEYDESEYSEGVRHGLSFGDGSIISYGTSVELRQFGDSQEMVPRFFNESREVHYGQPTTVVTKLPLHYKELPWDSESESYLRGFLAGWIGADGCVDTRGHVMLHNKDIDVLTFARKVAAHCGIPTTSIKMSRELNPWSGEYAPMYKLTFVKAAMYDEHMVIKQAHRRKLFASPEPKKQQSMKVEAVLPTDRFESVFCCVEEETHSFVIEAGYLTGNCFVVPTTDSREGWGKTTSDVIIISGLMGGVGLNVSPIRPRGTLIHGTGGVATGAVSLMELINGVGDVIVGGGGRRMALMLCLDINHPDMNEFLEAKLDLDRLNNANISLVLPQSLSAEQFVQYVRNDEEFELVFNGIPSGKTVRAKELWDKLVANSWRSGEPGILNGELANRMSNIWYHEPLISTNPCGEIWLEKYGCCDLGALVLPRFVEDGVFNWDMFDESIRLGVRFLDDVLTINHYPLPEIKENCENVRRIGLGVMGLHSMLLELGFTYDSPESFEFVDRLFNTLKNTAYDASVNLAIEKGPFGAYDQRFLDSGFVKTLKRGIRNKIKEHGMRNCAILTIAPTGTTSMVSGVSSGIEPLNPPVYWRTYFKNTDDGRRERHRELVVEESFYRFPDIVQSAVDVPVQSHFEMQKIVQKHIDNAVSKTINIANDFPEDQFGDIWLDYLPYLKGTTVYRYGSRENEPISPVPREDWDKVMAEQDIKAGKLSEEEFMALDCPDGVCDLPGVTSESVGVNA